MSPDEVIAYFDQETLFPLEVIEKFRGDNLKQTIISSLLVNPEFKNDDFSITPPKGADVRTMNGPWKIVSIKDLQTQLSYPPLHPKYVPSGFELLTVRTAKDAGPGGPEGSNAENRDVAYLTYDRGLQRLSITTRLQANQAHWEDPHAFEGQSNSKATPIKINGGAYNGTTANLVKGFGTQPHIWTVGATRHNRHWRQSPTSPHRVHRGS